MAYADFIYYTSTYFGTAIASADFAALALKASAVIDQITYGRAAVIVTAATDTATISKIKNAMCAVAEELQKEDRAGSADAVTSESSGSYSVSYAGNSAKTMTNIDKQIQAAELWLANTTLLYRGFLSGEYSNGEYSDG